jgi:TonB family protein
MRKTTPTLTEQELEIMKIVWDLGTVTVRQVYERLLQEREIAYTTVMTMMQVLERKGRLVKSIEEKAHVYKPAEPKKKVIGGMVQDFVNRVFNGSAEPLLLQLVEDDKLSTEDIEKLQEKIRIMSWTNLLHWSIQVFLLVAAAGATLHLARVRDARMRLWTLQLLLVACGVMPWFAQELPVIRVQFDGVLSGASGPRSAVPEVPFLSLPMIWMAGATAVLLRLLIAIVSFRRLREKSQLRDMRSGVEIRTGSAVASPVTFGFLRPVILLPEQAWAVDARLCEAMIAHELEHVRRRDWLMVVAEEMVRAVAWFHPAIWWLLSRIRAAREHVIDAIVAQERGADTYAECLLTAAQWRASSRARQQPFPAVAMNDGGSLEQRLKRILYPKESSMTRFHRVAAVAVLALTIFGMAAVSASAFPMFTEEKVNPKVTKRTIPKYPPLAKEAKVQGVVVLEVRIGKDGSVTNIRLVSGHPLLVPAAVEAVQSWEFEPGRQNGEAVEVDSTVEITFTLSD